VSNVLNDEKKQQVIALGRLGWPRRRIQPSIGVRRETASGYLREAGIALRQPGGWGRASPAKPANRVITDSGGAKPFLAGADSPACAKPANEGITGFGAELAANAPTAAEPKPGRSPSASACAPYRDAIQVGLAKGCNAMGIWQDLVDFCGFTGGYQSVRRFVRKRQGSPSPEACAVIETAPGEEAQGDYGEGPMVRDPHTGKYRRGALRARLFVLTLGCSRKSIRLLVFRSGSQTWAELHEKAFRRLGGATRVVVLDNLREGPHPGHLRSHAEPAVPRRAGALWCGRPALSCPPSGSEREGRVRRRPCQEDAAQRHALRKLGGSPKLPGSLGRTLGRHAHPRHHQAASRRPVRRRAAGFATAADRTFRLLPVR
jgi:hypothetical protein